MLTNLTVRLREFFYPVGNTPAANLLRDVPEPTSRPGEPCVLKLLSLACGDPRSILFSLYATDLQAPTKIHITCCDQEPAILARNTLLFAFLADRYAMGAPILDQDEFFSTTWNVFYHMFIPDGDLTIIQNQAQKLANLAESMDAWSSSTYGAWTRFVDEDTRVRVRDIWLLYARTASFTRQRKRDFEKRGRDAISNIYNTKIRDRGLVINGTRSAGLHATRSAKAVSTAFGRCLGSDGKGRLNPLFAISSASNGDFAVHYGTDPLLGFHLAQAFEYSDESNEIERMVSLAKSQFQEWCCAFVRHLADPCIALSLYCGDAIRFCYGLQAHNPQISEPPTISTVYKDPWSATALQLLPDERDFFDIIDTSNLLDHVGVLNVLPAVVPLLCREPSSVMYTESLLRAAEDPKFSLDQMLCSDVRTMSLLLGIAPVPYLTGVSVDNYISEIAMFGCKQFRLRIPWRVPAFGDQHFNSLDYSKSSSYIQIPRPSFEPGELASVLFQAYLRMFEYEDWSKSFSSLNQVSIMRQLISPIAADLRYYSRINLALLITMMKRNVSTDWSVCMAILLDAIESDTTLMIGGNCLQELRLHMHTFGLSPNLAIECPPRYLSLPPFEIFGPTPFDLGLLGEADVPSVIFVALVVPRLKLRVFTNESPDTIGTPGLHLSITHGILYQNSFHSIQCFFGRVVKGSENGICTADEDSTGWKGSSDLVVVCQVPVYTLFLGPRSSLRVGLAVNTSPSTVHFTMELGLENKVFDTGLEDSDRLHLLRKPPKSQLQEEQRPRASCRKTTPENPPPVAWIALDEVAQAKRISIRTHLERHTPASKALHDGASVVVVSESPCTTTVSISGCRPIILTYPYPVDGRSLKTRVARSSSWIEVSALLAQPLASNGYAQNPCPVVHNLRGELFSWALPRINLRKAPIIEVSRKSGWVEGFMDATFGTRERVRRAPFGGHKAERALSSLKESLVHIFAAFVGDDRENRSDGVAVLIGRGKEVRDCDTAIIASAIRHDGESGSLVLDAYFVPLEHTGFNSLSSTETVEPTEAHLLKISRDEEMLWKRILPATAERCRDWQHHDTCQYNPHGGVPTSLTHGENPLCSCGEGVMLERFPSVAPYSRFRDRATRIAIPALFAIPYVEDVHVPSSVFNSLAYGLGRALPTENSVTSLNDVCASCGTVKPELKGCQRCKKVKYCNHVCQKAHWKAHKKACRGS